MPDIVHDLRGLAIGMASPSLARDTVSRAADEIERLRAALGCAREKLQAYYAQTGGRYEGGQPYDQLLRQIDAALSE